MSLPINNTLNNLDTIGLQGLLLDELLRRILNLSGNQTDSVMPPTAAGGFRLPLVNELRVLSIDNWPGGSRVYLTWNYDTKYNRLIDKFEVYAYAYDGFNNTFNKGNFLLNGPVCCTTPPVSIDISVPNQVSVVFEVKPVLKSGLTNDFAASATTSKVVNPPVWSADSRSTRLNTLAKSAGVAVLVAGQVLNVPCPEIETTDYVVCIPVVLGGTPGIVTAQNIVARTNFDLISTSATDTSTILWFLVKLKS